MDKELVKRGFEEMLRTERWYYRIAGRSQLRGVEDPHCSLDVT